MDRQFWQHISMDAGIMVGKPVIRGTRIPVELIVRMLAQGIPENEIHQSLLTLRNSPRLACPLCSSGN